MLNFRFRMKKSHGAFLKGLAFPCKHPLVIKLIAEYPLNLVKNLVARTIEFHIIH